MEPLFYATLNYRYGGLTVDKDYPIYKVELSSVAIQQGSENYSTAEHSYVFLTVNDKKQFVTISCDNFTLRTKLEKALK